MEQLFAIRVLVHYYDKPKVDHAAVRRLVSAAAVNTLRLLLSDGTTISLSSYVETPPSDRKAITEIADSSASSLVQIASVFMLAEARAAADALCTSPNELETACSALERLLGCLITTRPQLPIRSINQSARVKLGTAARRRTLRRISLTSTPSDKHASILKSVNAVLRLCDVATHCLAVVSRQSIATALTCQTAVNLSSRLLTLAASLHDVQHVDSNPALSFFSSNSLRTALVSGAMHLGAITIEHLDIEPMTWIHFANRIVTNSATSIPQRTSVMSALFGGMIKGGKAYETCQRDVKAAERAVCLLSTLHVVLETDVSRDFRNRSTVIQAAAKSSSEAVGGQDSPAIESNAISQAARSFLGERVVAAEEDGDEGRIAARTVYQACEEYAERAGETSGVMGLLSHLFAAAGRKCHDEVADEAIVPVSDSALNISCAPDESDASSDGQPDRTDSQTFPMDVFDNPSRDGFGVITTTSATDDAIEPGERLEMHRQVGALALDTLAHWVDRAHTLRRYAELDISDFSVRACRSASLFSFVESSSGYDLRSAMSDFGSLLGAVVEQRLSDLPEMKQTEKWVELISNATRVSVKPNPILSNLVSSCRSEDVISSLLQSFFELGNKAASPDHSDADYQGLSTDNMLFMLLSDVTPDNALHLAESIVDYLRKNLTVNSRSVFLMSHRTACFMLLSFAIFTFLQVSAMIQTTRQALAGLYDVDSDNASDVMFPGSVEAIGGNSKRVSSRSVDSAEVQRLFDLLQDIPDLMESICDKFQVLQIISTSVPVRNDKQEADSYSVKCQRVGYHMLWAFSMTEDALQAVEEASGLKFAMEESATDESKLSPFMCHSIFRSESVREHATLVLQKRKEHPTMAMYLAECITLLHVRNLSSENAFDLVLLLTSMVKNVVEIMSSTVSEDVADNYSNLRTAFRIDLTSFPKTCGGVNQSVSRDGSLTEASISSRQSCIELAMGYIRKIRSGNLSELLTHVMNSASQLLALLSDSEIEKANPLVSEIMKVVLFLPKSFDELSIAMFQFVEKYAFRAFSNCEGRSEGRMDVITFMTRVCGLTGLIERDAKSASGIHSLCRFASETSIDSDVDTDSLTASLCPDHYPERFEHISIWLKKSLPRVSLEQMLSYLLVPSDDSAVAVSSYSQSLSLLTEASERSEVWQTSVLLALKDLLVDGDADFPERMVRRSVMQSATMNDGLVSLFERVVGTSKLETAEQILFKCFETAKRLFEEENSASLESRVRLLNFTVRVSISHGHTCLARAVTPSVPLEPELFKLILSSLEKTTKLLRDQNEDQTLKRIVLFLSGLVDSIQCGLYADHQSVFDFPVGADGESTSTSSVCTSGDDVKRDGEGATTRSASESVSSSSPYVSEETSVAPLCTYTTTGDQYVEQHWYFCYSCDLAGTDGVCSVCARLCHQGCELAYSKFSRFFCDCGHGSEPPREASSSVAPSSEEGEGNNSNSHVALSQKSRSVPVKRRKPCVCLKASKSADRNENRPESLASRRASISNVQNEREILVGASLRKKLCSELEIMRASDASHEIREKFVTIETAFSSIMKEARTVNCLLSVALYLLQKLDGNYIARHTDCQWVSTERSADAMKEIFEMPSILAPVTNGKKLRSSKLLRSGSFDLVSSSSERSLMSQGSIISYSPFHRVTAVASKSGVIEFVHMADALLTSDPSTEKTLDVAFGRTTVPFTVKDIQFHPENTNILLVVGVEKILVLYCILEDGNPFWRHLGVEVGLSEFDGYDGSNKLINATWIDGEVSHLLVTSEHFVKIFDVAVDAFCPSFFAKVPVIVSGNNASDPATRTEPSVTKEAEKDHDEVECSRKIVSALVVRESRLPSHDPHLFVLILTSDGALFLSMKGPIESASSIFKFCFNVYSCHALPESAKITALCFDHTHSTLLVSFDNGSVLLQHLAFKFENDDIQVGVKWAHLYKEVIPSGPAVELLCQPDVEPKFIFFQKAHSLPSGGVLKVTDNQEIEVDPFSGSPSSSVLGIVPFIATTVLSNPTESGALLLLDDGSMHRVHLCDDGPRLHSPERCLFSDIVDRRRKRNTRVSHGVSDSQDGSGPLPDPIGFFEISRLVSEHVVFDGPDGDDESLVNYESMGVILAGESGECIVSAKENEPFHFSASISNKSLVLVGARFRFGGTEISRNRVPSEIKVFGRVVSAPRKNGVKRWVDIPFAISESTRSPRKVTFELLPRRSTQDARPGTGGLVAIDCLELHAVSDVEFTERKMAFETEMAQRLAEKLKKQKEFALKGSFSGTWGSYQPDLSSSESTPCVRRFSHEQAATLAVILSTDRDSFASSGVGGRLLSEVNSLWSTTIEGTSSRDPAFLYALLQASLQLVSNVSVLKEPTAHQSLGVLPLLAKGSQLIADREVVAALRCGASPQSNSVERCLFSVGGLVRSLLTFGSSLHYSTTSWRKQYDSIMPVADTTISLLRSHLNLCRAGRLSYKSIQRTCLSAVDIALLQSLKDSLDAENDTAISPGSKALTILVNMMCGFDQFIRLASSQRLLELFDSANGLTDFKGSPFEGNAIEELTNGTLELENQAGKEVLEPKECVEDADGGQGWAYRCDSCSEVCDKEWWRCNDCDDFDLCTTCLRAQSCAVDSLHKKHHMLLRNTIEDDVNDQSEGDGPRNLPPVAVAIQGLVRNIVDEVLRHLGDGTFFEKWQFLDAAETLTLLLGSRSPPDLRILRINALFKSSFPSALRQELERCENEVNTSTARRESNSSKVSRSWEPLLLLLRILLSSKGSVMPLHIHGQGFPSLLLSLLSKMYEQLQVIVRDLSSGKVQDGESQTVHTIMDEGVWNERVSALSYELMSNRHDPNVSKSYFGLFYVADGIDERESIFLNVFVELLRVLDYAYRSASSSTITAQMKEVPQNILCDIINSCETAIVHCDDDALLKDISLAASSLLKTLSLDDADALNNIQNKYLYQDQGKRLRDLMAEVDGFEGLTSYKAAVDIADALNSLHRAASKHPVTWRTFASENEQIVYDVYHASKLFDGKVEVQVRGLQLLAAGLSVSKDLSSHAISGLAISEFDQVMSASPKKEGADLVTKKVEKNVDQNSSKDSWTIAELVTAGRGQQVGFQRILLDNECEMVDFLIRKVMLKSQSNHARRAASQIIVFALSRGASCDEDSAFVKAVDVALSNGLELMQFAGDLADGLMHCLRFFIRCCQESCFGPSSSSLLSSFTVKLMQLLKKRCAVLVSHPNARLYCRLSEILDLTGYYLEADPCMTCATATWEASGRRDSRLDMIRAETKFTDSSIMHRLISAHEIHSVSVKIIDPRRSRRVKKISVYYSTRSVSDAAELKNAEHPWKNLKSLTLGPNSCGSTMHLTVPVAIANIKLEFIEFHSSSDMSISAPGFEGQGQSSSFENGGSRRGGTTRTAVNLQCPRCSRSVTDRHGICRNCHENAYQCRQCRNINYENLDGFLCNECGYCKHGRFEFSVNGRATHVAEPIRNEEDRKRASKTIEKETSSVHRCMEQLSRIRSSIIKSLNSGIPNDDTGHKTKLFPNSRIGIADLLDSVAPRSEIAVLEALLEGQVGQEVEDTSHVTQGVSITEEVLAEGTSSNDPHERELRTNRPGSNAASPVNRSSRNDGAPKVVQTETPSFINRSTLATASTYSKDCKTIFLSMSRGIRVLMMTRAELVRYANHVGGDRLQQGRRCFDESDVDLEESVLNEPYRNLDDVLSKNAAPCHTSSCCYGCTQSFIAKCVQLVQTILKCDRAATRLIRTSVLAKDMLLVCSLCEKHDIRNDIRDVVTLLVNDNLHATQQVGEELARKIGFCIDSYETVDAHSVARFEMAVLESTSVLDDSCWEERLRLVIRILFKASTEALTCSSVAESIILPCLRVALRLTRSDVDLTVIERSSPTDHVDAASEAATNFRISRDPQADNSETDNDDIESAGPAAQIVQDSLDGDVPSRMRALHSNLVGMFGSDIQDSGSVVGGNATQSHREVSRVDDRRIPPRLGSDVVPSSRAPSSIGTAFDVHMSDEEIDLSNERSEDNANVNIDLIQSVLERDHDGKFLSANIGEWLEGKQTHSSWMSNMAERSRDEEGEKSVVATDGAIGVPSVQQIFSKWKLLQQKSQRVRPEVRQVPEPFSSMLSIDKGNWIVRLMLFTPCTAVRKEACTLLELLCGQEEMLQLQLLDVLSGPSLALGADVGDKSKEFFDLLDSTLTSKTHRLYLIGKGFLPRVASLIRLKAERLIRSEVEAEASVGLVNFMEGYALKRLVSLLRLTLEVIPSKRCLLREKVFERDQKIVKCLQQAYLYVRKLISLKTRLTDECATQLGEVLLSKEFLFAGPTVTAIVSACVEELKFANLRNDAQAVAILLDELCLMLCPERSEPTCLLTLNKAPTQEEFIRGSMSRNPYSSASFDGPLMRDVKNKICKDLDLPGLLEDDFAMELLVAGNVVKLDLPIMAVFEQVWRKFSAAQISSNIPPGHLARNFGLRRTTHGVGSRTNATSRGEGFRGTLLSIRRVNSEREGSDDGNRADVRLEPPMVVVYRLSGLDGEATEPIVDSLPVESNDEQSSEELYRDTIILGRVGGFDVLFQLLAVVGSWGDDAETAVRAPALRLLRASCEVSQNRALLAKSPNAVSTLLNCAASAFEHAQGSPVAIASAESLLIAAEQILAQQRGDLDAKPGLQHDTVHVSSQDPEEVITRVKVFLGRLAKATSPKAEYSILHLLPFLIQGMKNAIDLVLEQFQFSWENIDYEGNDQRNAKQLGIVIFATPSDLHGNAFAAQMISSGVAEAAVKYIVHKFLMPRKENLSHWDEALEELGVPLVLKLLTGLSSFLGCDDGQAGPLLREIILARNDFIPVLSQLEMAVSDNSIGTSAEELLEGLSRDKEIRMNVENEREAIKCARRKAAQASRLAILKQTGLSSFTVENDRQAETVAVQGDEETSHSAEKKDSEFLKMMEDLPDEIGPSCVVCGDGFKCRPEEALSLYVFCKKIPLELSGRGGDGQSSKNGESGNNGNSVNRMDWEVWAPGRPRNSGGSGSRPGSNYCFTSVTHMNAIHMCCHREAARVDRSSRRDEWDAASLRNSQTKCNNLFPVRPPITLQTESEVEDAMILKQAKTSFAAVVEAYFSRLVAQARTSLSQTKMVLYDLGRSLLRFADGSTGIFSEYAKGGGSHSNASIIPHLVQLVIFLMEGSSVVVKNSGDAGDDGDAGTVFYKQTPLLTQQAALSKYLGEDEIGDVTYYLATSVVLQDLDEWTDSMCKFLRRGVKDAVLPRNQFYRLMVFADVANRVLKHNVVKENGKDWIHVFKRHMGLNETFSEEFGDAVNERWEKYIRNVKSEEQFFKAIERNLEVGCVAGDEKGSDTVAKLRQCLDGL